MCCLYLYLLHNMRVYNNFVFDRILLNFYQQIYNYISNLTYGTVEIQFSVLNYIPLGKHF